MNKYDFFSCNSLDGYYSLYYLSTTNKGMVFFKYDSLNDDSVSIPEYEKIKKSLKKICLKQKEYDIPLSYKQFILPILRELTLNDILK